MEYQPPQHHITPQPQGTSSQAHEDIKSILAHTLEWNKRIYEQNQRLHKRITIMMIGNYVRLAFILIPIIIAAFYLPPLIRDYLAPFFALYETLQQ